MSGIFVLFYSLCRIARADGNFYRTSLHHIGYRDDSQLCRAFNYFVTLMIKQHLHLLYDNLEFFLDRLPSYSDAITRRAALWDVNVNYIYCFIDGHDDKVQRVGAGPMYPGGEDADRRQHAWRIQEAFYSKYRGFHGIKTITFIFPDGVTGYSSPSNSRRIHDSRVTQEAGFDTALRNVRGDGLVQGDGIVHRAYGDKGFF
jgi:hypothetical protein